MEHKMKIIDAYRLKKQLINEFGYREAGILSMIDDQPEVLLNRNSKGEITQRMKRIEIMAKMDEMDAAQEIVEFLINHKFYYKKCEWYDGHRLDAVYGLAQYLGEEVSDKEGDKNGKTNTEKV